jgi:hypothetical protein
MCEETEDTRAVARGHHRDQQHYLGNINGTQYNF